MTQTVGGRSLWRRARQAVTFGMPLTDQAVISGGNFIFNVLLARAIPLDQYGRFALVLGTLGLLQTGSGALLYYPLSVRGATADKAVRDRLVASTLILNLMLSAVLATLAGLVLTVTDEGGRWLPTVAMLLASQLQESTRRGLLTDFRYAASVPGDALSYLGQVAVLLVVVRYGGANIGTALWIMAGTSLASVAVQLPLILPRGVRPLPLWPCLVDFWSMGRFALTSNLLSIARTQVLLWLVLGILGPAGAGALQLVLTLVNVVNPIVAGVCTQVPQAASRAVHRGYRAAWAAAWPAIATGYILVAGFMALLLVFPAQVLHGLYGAKVDPTMLVGPVRALAVGAVFYYAASTTCTFLHGIQAGRDGLVVDVITTVLLAIAGPILIVSLGVYGATLALALSFAVRAVLLAAYTAPRLMGPGASRARSETGRPGPAIEAEAR